MAEKVVNFRKYNIVKEYPGLWINIAEPMPETMAEPHRHEYVELVYVIDGYGVQIIDGVSYKVSSGDMVLIEPGQSHRFYGEPTFKLFYASFLPSFVSKDAKDDWSLKQMTELDEFKIYSSTSAKLPTKVSINKNSTKFIVSLAKNMFREFEAPGNSNAYFLRSMLSVVIHEYFKATRLGKTRRSNSQEIISEELLEYIRCNCNEEISLTAIAEKCNYNPSYFSRHFKEVTGLSFSEYVRSVRMKRASEMLDSSALSVEEICHMVGYSDRTTFYKFFKEAYGETPAEYRKNRLFNSPI